MTVYEPAEDSFLLASVIQDKDLEGLKCLEVGTGSGFLAEKMLENNAEKVVAVDINPEAVKQASNRLSGYSDVDVFESDMFGNIHGRFDLIVFNPPYLPEEASKLGDEEIWSGGAKGRQITERFLEQASDYLSDTGEVYFVASSLADWSIEEVEVVCSKKLWFETLYVVRVL